MYNPWAKLGQNERIINGKICYLYVDGLYIKEYKTVIERGKTMEEIKKQLIGQKEGIEFALDLLKVQEKALEEHIIRIDEQIKEIE